jgi:hypothetical protein
MEGQVPVFISPRNKVAQIYPQALGYLSVASYDSQGRGGAFYPDSTQDSIIFCDVTPCSIAEFHRRFEYIYCLHLQD